jgi:hypothetical protein
MCIVPKSQRRIRSKNKEPPSGDSHDAFELSLGHELDIERQRFGNEWLLEGAAYLRETCCRRVPWARGVPSTRPLTSRSTASAPNERPGVSGKNYKKLN